MSWRISSVFTTCLLYLPAPSMGFWELLVCEGGRWSNFVHSHVLMAVRDEGGEIRPLGESLRTIPRMVWFQDSSLFRLKTYSISNLYSLFKFVQTYSHGFFDPWQWNLPGSSQRPHRVEGLESRSAGGGPPAFGPASWRPSAGGHGEEFWTAGAVCGWISGEVATPKKDCTILIVP